MTMYNIVVLVGLYIHVRDRGELPTNEVSLYCMSTDNSFKQLGSGVEITDSWSAAWAWGWLRLGDNSLSQATGLPTLDQQGIQIFFLEGGKFVNIFLHNWISLL